MGGALRNLSVRDVARGATRYAIWVVALTAVACRRPPPAPEPIHWQTLDAPEPYESRPPPMAATRPSAEVSAEAGSTLEAAIQRFLDRGRRVRDTSRQGARISPLQTQNWQSLLDAIDAYLAQGLTRTSSLEMIRARAAIEVELEADAARYAEVPQSLLDEILAREARLGIRVGRIKRAGDRRARPGSRVVDAERRLAWPVVPLKVTSVFGKRFHPLRKRYVSHQGIDLRAATGQVVLASADGLVTAARFNGGHGLQVALDHGAGMSTRYSHLSRALVRPGARIRRGEPLGLAGATGDVTGPHLHFEIWLDGEPTDPLDVFEVED